MIELTISVAGKDATRKKLLTLSDKMKNRSTVNRDVAIQFHSWVIDNYDSEGGKVGKWPALKNRSYAERKKKMGKKKLLVISGRLRNSFIPFSDNDKAGIGSDVIYSRTHQEGLNGVLQRRMLPNLQEASDMALKVYNFYIEKATKEAN